METKEKGPAMNPKTKQRWLVGSLAEARMVLTTRRLLDEGDLDGVRKHLGFMLQAHTDYLRIVVENDETPERISILWHSFQLTLFAQAW